MISVLQAQVIAANGTSGSFASNVTPGSTIFLILTGYSSTTQGPSSSPVFNGSTPAGTVHLCDLSEILGSDVELLGAWMLPDVAGGAASVGVTAAGWSTSANTGLFGIEVAGLGAAPYVDKSSTNEGNGASTAITSNATGAIAAAPEFVIGFAGSYGQTQTAPSSPWTDLGIPSGAGNAHSQVIYQVVTSSGGTYTYATTGAAGNLPWVAGVFTIAGVVAHTATAALTVTPVFSAARTRGKYRTGALTVSPSFSAARTRGRYRTAGLTVTPSFSAARTVAHVRSAALTVTPTFSAARSRGHSRTAGLTVTPAFATAKAQAHVRTAALTVTPTFSAAPQRGTYRTAALTVTPSSSAARVRGKYRTGSLAVPPSFSATRITAHVRTAALTVAPSFSAIPAGGAVTHPVFTYPAYWTVAWVMADTRVTVSPAGAQTATVTSAVLGESAATLYPPGPAVIYPSP